MLATQLSRMQKVATRRPRSRALVTVRAFLEEHKGDGHANGHHQSMLSLSLFTPYKALPADGHTIPEADAKCDPAVRKCKTPIYTFETKCHGCSGTGFVKSHANGRRASLCTCLLCHGLGYVRLTTSRFVPDDPGAQSETLTLARPATEPEVVDMARLSGRRDKK